MTGSEHLRNGKACGVLPVSSVKYPLTVDRGGTNHEPAQGDRCLLMYKSSKDYTVRSKPTERQLWHKSDILLMVIGGMCYNSASHPAVYGALSPQTHADPCPLSKVPTMGMQVSELDLGMMEESCLI